MTSFIVQGLVVLRSSVHTSESKSYFSMMLQMLIFLEILELAGGGFSRCEPLAAAAVPQAAEGDSAACLHCTLAGPGA